MDKKKISVVLVVLLLSMWSATAETRELKFYSDWNNGYSGWAKAFFITFEEQELNLTLGTGIVYLNNDFQLKRYLNKLSKEEEFLIWKALNEYDLKNEEAYFVAVQCGNSVETLMLNVRISENGRSFRWYDGLYAVEKEKFFQLDDKDGKEVKADNPVKIHWNKIKEHISYYMTRMTIIEIVKWVLFIVIYVPIIIAIIRLTKCIVNIVKIKVNRKKVNANTNSGKEMQDE